MAKRFNKRATLFLIPILLFIIFIEIFFLFPKKENAISTNTCRGGLSQEECWNQQLIKTIRDDGIDQGFALFNRLHSQNKKFRDDCHAFAHTLGREAYTVFENENQKIPFSDQMSICGYGFFHGLLEVVTTKNDNGEIVRKFCDSYREEGKKGRNYYECFHGVGHGAIARHEAKNLNLDVLIEQAINTCKTLVSTQKELEFCARGVFMRSETESFARSEKVKESAEKLGLLAACEGQTGDNAKWCYQAEGRFLLVRAQYNFAKAAAHIENAKDDTLKNIAVRELAISLSKGGGLDLENQIRKCQTLQKVIQQDCIKGLVDGVLLYSQEPSDIKKAESICVDGSLYVQYKSSCEAEIEVALQYFTQS